jgi:tetratricopeptide (TPR) repeat protein
MEKASWLTHQVTAFILLFAVFTPITQALAKCPDEKTLSRNGRIAMVEVQKLTGENKLAQAKATLLKFNRDYPDENHPYVAFTLAGLLTGENLLSNALVWYQKTIDMCPSYGPAWQNMGKICYDLKKFDQAALALENAYELMEKKNYLLLYHAAIAHISDKKPEKALVHMQFLTSGQAGDPSPDWVKLLVNLSIEQHREKSAIVTVENLLAHANPGPYLFRLAATLYLHVKKYRQAAEALSVYGMLSPLNLTEQILLADLYNNLGMPFKAAQCYEKIIKKNPEKKIYRRLASAWFDACEPEKAMMVAKNGLTFHPSCPKLWKLVGWIHYEKKEFKQASQAFSQAFILKGTDSKSLFMHGLCACKAGQYEIAKKALKKASHCSRYKIQALALIRQMKLENDHS